MSRGDRVSLKSRGKKPLGNFNKAISDQLRSVPKMFLKRQLASIISEKAPEAPAEVVEALASHLATTPSEDFTWDDGDPGCASLDIDLTLADLTKAYTAATEFSEREMPEIVQGCLETSAGIILKSLKKDWPDQKLHDQLRMLEFQDNLMDRWGPAFDTLRMMYTIAVEMGNENVVARRRSRSRKHPVLRDTVSQLHARSCQVAFEIITLMENGLADGAMARWRTLHELTVVATLLVDHGEELAIRYRAHEAIEAKRAMDRFILHHAQLGYAPPKKREIAAIEREFTSCLERYGDKFGSEYGWAAHHLELKKPRLVDLEAAVGKAPMHSYYRMASYNVHAGARGIGFRLGLMDGEGMPTALAGVSNAGFVDPGRNTAYDLTQVTSLLAKGTRRFDRMLEWKILLQLRDDAVKKFDRAQRQLDRAHRDQLKSDQNPERRRQQTTASSASRR